MYYAKTFMYSWVRLFKTEEGAAVVRKIIVLNPAFSVEQLTLSQVLPWGKIVKALPLINALVVKVRDKASVSALAGEPWVQRLDEDIRITAISEGEMPVTPEAKPKAKPKPKPSTQVLPWGIKRIKADSAWAVSTGAKVKVAIVDTGIDRLHKDLKVVGGVNTVNHGKTFHDDNGHGTHVAGIVAALNNSLGVVGIAPNVLLYGVKVLNKYGSGYLSDVIEGLQWCITNKMRVINMSLGTDFDSSSFKTAIAKVAKAGITMVAAAGNSGCSGDTVTYPAKYPEVIAVTAIDETNSFAGFSSCGPSVDLTAPGVAIYSTYKGNAYATLSGTSMAAPHVAGTCALVLAKKSLNPTQMMTHLKKQAEVLPGLNSNQQGAGLVNALAAVKNI